MINKFEAIGIFLCIGVMAFALFLLRMQENSSLLSLVTTSSQVASVVSTKEDEDTDEALKATISSSFDSKGNITQLIIDDVVKGDGATVKKGDTVAVHYIGTLQSGQQFDNSYTKGQPFVFTVGEGRVIKGWDDGLIGMKVGGQRILVVPPELAYGSNAVGTIPANSTLVFAVALIEIQ